jgi:hypothetical protein
MGKFIKKPVEIEALRLTQNNYREVVAWANDIQPADKQILLVFEPGNTMLKRLLIPTKEGEMQCSVGDYLIKEPFPTDDRMFYPCKPDMFELTYDPIKK